MTDTLSNSVWAIAETLTDNHKQPINIPKNFINTLFFVVCVRHFN